MPNGLPMGATGPRWCRETSEPDGQRRARAVTPTPQVGPAARWSLDPPKLAYNDEVIRELPHARRVLANEAGARRPSRLPRGPARGHLRRPRSAPAASATARCHLIRAVRT